MALIECKECRNQISSTANACPNCGWDLKGYQKNQFDMIQLIAILVVTGVLFGLFYLGVFDSTIESFKDNFRPKKP